MCSWITNRWTHGSKERLPFARITVLIFRLVSMMGLRLSPIRRRVSMMVMMMMMVTLFVGDASVFARWIGSDITDDQFWAIALGIVTAEILSVSWFIQGLLATEWRMTGLMTSGFVQIFPGLTVVAVQATSALRRTAVETGDSITIGRCTVTIMLAASSAVSIITMQNTLMILSFNLLRNYTA